MLRTLFSPLSGRLAPSPVISRHENLSGDSNGDDITPEDFARDVLIEVMRKSVERLKFAQGLSARTEVSLVLIFSQFMVVDDVIQGACGDTQDHAGRPLYQRRVPGDGWLCGAHECSLNDSAHTLLGCL